MAHLQSELVFLNVVNGFTFENANCVENTKSNTIDERLPGHINKMNEFEKSKAKTNESLERRTKQ